MTVNFLDLRGQTDIASALIDTCQHKNDKAVILARVSSCEFIRKTCISYVCLMDGVYSVHSEILDKYQNEKQGFKHLIYRAIQHAKRIGAKDISLIVVNPNVYYGYERMVQREKLKLNYSGSFVLIEDKEQIGLNYFLEYLSELYKGYIPPSGYRFKTTSLEDALRWLDFTQGAGNFENHIDVPILKELSNIYIEVVYNDKRVVVRYGLLCWLTFDSLMRHHESKNKRVELDDVMELASNYLEYFGKLDTLSIKPNLMGMVHINLSKKEKNQLLNRLIDFDSKEKFDLLSSRIQFYIPNTEKVPSYNALAKHCSDIYKYHLALVKFKSEQFETDNIEAGEEAQNVYHAVANWMFKGMTGRISKEIGAKQQLMEVRALALYSMLMDGVIAADDAWDLEIAVIVQQADMLINGLDFSFKVEKSFDIEEFCVVDNNTQRRVKVPFTDIIELLKQHHKTHKKTPINLDYVLDIKN